METGRSRETAESQVKIDFVGGKGAAATGIRKAWLGRGSRGGVGLWK